ncbi:hypothetical protein U91I_00011 [alpha proteobacterium U9-1i]|nr:hypothetical protein U91I_00011 [alpha proteobacterium U9-1i]
MCQIGEAIVSFSECQGLPCKTRRGRILFARTGKATPQKRVAAPRC